MIQISLFASSVRHHLWMECLDSLKSNECQYEVVFAGNLDRFQVRPYLKKYPFLKYIHCGNVKPAQCYEIARRHCSGIYVMWIADDCEFSEHLLDNIVTHMGFQTHKTLLSVKTNENSTNNNLDDHTFFERNHLTPLMAPLGVIRRDYLNELGGFDRRFTAGQYENMTAMMVYADGGIVQKYEEGCVYIEHLIKHGAGTKFWTGYEHDRKILEDSWCVGGYKPAPAPYYKEGTQKELPPVLQVIGESEEDSTQIIKEIRYAYKNTDFLGKRGQRICPIDDRQVENKPLLPFEPYEDTSDLLTKSQSYTGIWE